MFKISELPLGTSESNRQTCRGRKDNSRLLTSTPANNRIAPIVDSEVAVPGVPILSRTKLKAWPRYSRHSRSVRFPAAAYASESITALRRAGSANPVRKTVRKVSTVMTLKTGSRDCRALSGTICGKPTGRGVQWPGATYNRRGASVVWRNLR